MEVEVVDETRASHIFYAGFQRGFDRYFFFSDHAEQDWRILWKDDVPAGRKQAENNFRVPCWQLCAAVGYHHYGHSGFDPYEKYASVAHYKFPHLVAVYHLWTGNHCNHSSCTVF